ncbi:uncharacterized protein C8Q71DRAFT_731474 [Rhodofomes roseus]|uniref:DUF676 domain-containing protein n=1 Tax=Rhodofomes roseus TaxID=34475 RepID=A0ABQ8L0M3_9APHY|nr:uncharacterized protein C8Q71DRAFT_731474 [Rhodofomes roseus]KAH9844147.1 hypothetical protein C8Q71DRAFT_731474 [Rhodofomes roseus]
MSDAQDTILESEPTAAIPAPPLPPDLLLVIFIHGFKGTDSTFVQFPQRLQHILSETIPNTVVECIVFPAYETKGDLNEAIVRFADWLTNLTVQREVANGSGGGAGKARIVLCGHSMGGLLAADALLEFVQTRPDSTAPLWPNIVACIAFDTPYLGLHPYVFKNSATQAASYVQSARSAFSAFQSFTSKSTTATTTASAPKAAITAPPMAAQTSAGAWQKWAPAAYAVGGALVAGAAAGTAYWKRDDIGVGYKWTADHMKYVGTLWDEGRLHKRLERLLAIERDMGVLFRTLYTFIPADPPTQPEPRMFIVLPKRGTTLAEHFLEAPNTLAQDEVQAHTGMFGSKTNDGYYELGLVTAQFVRDAVAASKESAGDTGNEGTTAATADEVRMGHPGDSSAHPQTSPQPAHTEEDLML